MKEKENKPTEEEQVESIQVEEDAESVDTENGIHSTYVIPDVNDTTIKHQLSGMFQNWFLDYASYVILDRAVPHLADGLKPVQRRILHTMKRMDDGRYNKVANIVGETMKFHPHGDQSIYSSLVTLGQKDLLIDCQGNWGNIFTGDRAAAPRYIEARLNKFALEVLFNAKTTDWKLSYDGRNKEPEALPAKFPIVLAQGAEGIGVGLSTKILPHNFNELCDASVAYLKGEEFTLYPDFATGGYMDVSRYMDGQRKGKLRVRAKINKIDNKTLSITEIPYDTTTSSVIESILKANERGKIQIKKVDDNTAANVEIIVHLAPGRSCDKTIDALYAFTDCQVSIAPNCCVIFEEKPHFLTVSDVLRFSADNTLKLLKRELTIRESEILESIFFMSLERIFIEERIYKDKEYEQSKSNDEAVAHIAKRLVPFTEKFIRPVEDEDILKLLEIKMKRILRFNSDAADKALAELKAELKEVRYNKEHITEYTIKWFEHLKEKYGAQYPRHTEIRNFDNIEITKVADVNEKLYLNKEEGFIGTSLKHDEFLCNCSSVDDIIIFYKDGKFKVVKVQEKVYVGKNVLWAGVFKKGDNRTIYNMVYRDGRDGTSYIKRFAAGGLSRDKEYDLTQGTPGTRVLYFSANPNGEAEIIKCWLKPKPKLKNLIFERDFSDIAIKGRASMGNIFTKNDVLKINMKQKGASTLGGREVWYDADVNRLNYDGRGTLLGEFNSDDSILMITKRGTYQNLSFELTTHFADDVLIVEKFDPEKIWTAALYDADQKFPYLKRFPLEDSKKEVSFLGDNPKSHLLLLVDDYYARIKVTFTPDANGTVAEPMIIDADEFIGIKSLKAKGKRLTTLDIAEINRLEPLKFPEASEGAAEDSDVENASDESGEQPLNAEEDGQLKLF
ncbi:MAG: DNA gyrase/topoisomerase IV subunit A [Paludibacteraceae bacterium]|nr:DNA gyrase/topoisomerase IV subunit A [Paludibacteraceae bacterium]